MDADTGLILGGFLALLACPALIAAWADGRRPYLGTLLLFVGCALIAWAWRVSGGYAMAEVPDVFFAFLGRLF